MVVLVGYFIQYIVKTYSVDIVISGVIIDISLSRRSLFIYQIPAAKFPLSEPNDIPDPTIMVPLMPNRVTSDAKRAVTFLGLNPVNTRKQRSICNKSVRVC